MFVDIGANHSVIDRVKLSYIYDEIDSYEVRSHNLYVRFDWIRSCTVNIIEQNR